MAQDQVEEVKRKVDIVDIVSGYVNLKKSGSNFAGLCPFHNERSPSFMVSPELQIYKCFGCGKAGDVYTFLMEYEKMDFPHALRVLADRAGVKLQPFSASTSFGEKEEIYKINRIAAEFYHFLLTSHEAGKSGAAYLSRRGMTKKTIDEFNLGFAPATQSALFSFLTEKRKVSLSLLEKAGLIISRGGRAYDRFSGRIIFPQINHYGEVLGFSGRVVEEHGEVAKYINTPETLVYKKGTILYGLSQTREAIKREGFCVVVEGEFDLLSSWQAGVDNIVAIKGSALTSDQAELLSRFCEVVHLALDSDFAGDQAARRGIKILQDAGFTIRVVDIGKYKDPDEVASKKGEVWKKMTHEAKNVYDFLIDSTFAKFDPTTTEGKAAIGRSLSPILASIEDEIVRAHCLIRVAKGLGVSEEAVGSQVARFLGKPTGKAEEAPKTGKDRRSILEEQLLRLLLQQKAPFLDVGWKTPIIRRLVDTLEDSEFGQDSNLSAFSDKLPPELKDFFAGILLFPGEPESAEKAQQEIDALRKAIYVLEIKEEIRQLSDKIKELEVQEKADEIDIIEKKISELGKKLTELVS